MDERDGIGWFLAIGSRGETGCHFRRKVACLSVHCSWALSRPLGAVASIGKQQRYHPHSSFLTDGTEGDINPANPEQLLLPGLFPGVWLGYGTTVSEDLTA
jgi:hypothetical protein